MSVLAYALLCHGQVGNACSAAMQLILHIREADSMFSISGKPLPPRDKKRMSWSVGVLCATEYARQVAGFDQRFRAERKRQRKIAAKLGLDFSEYDNTETLVSGDCVRRQLLDSVPLAMERASRKDPND